MKSLILSIHARKTNSHGEIFNLMQRQTESLSKFSSCFYFVFGSLIEMTITVFLLWFYIGVSAFVGLAVLVVIVPFNSCVSGKNLTLECEKMKKNDKKVKTIYEVLNGIKVCIKFGL